MSIIYGVLQYIITKSYEIDNDPISSSLKKRI
jgi:hypothetical protein